VVAYVAPAAIAWGTLGLLVNLAPLSRWALALIVAYGTYYGVMETTGRSGLPAASTRWQVPAEWVDHAPRWRRVLVWGSLLGPGFATRNPYAGFGLLPLAVASLGTIRAGITLAVLIGIVHAIGRSLALLRDIRDVGSADYLFSVMRSMRWRSLDGLGLLAAAGIATMNLVHS
jgi:hypothetical protein